MSRLPKQQRTYRAVHHYFALQTTRGMLLAEHTFDHIACVEGIEHLAAL